MVIPERPEGGQARPGEHGGDPAAAGSRSFFMFLPLNNQPLGKPRRGSYRFTGVSKKHFRICRTSCPVLY